MTTTTMNAPPPTPAARRYARHFASPASWAVLRAIAAAREPLPAKVLVLRSDVPRTICYALIAELAGRGLIEGGRDGWLLTPRATKLVLRMAALTGKGGSHDG